MKLPEANHMPIEEIIARCDELFNANDPAALGEHLRFWRQRARELGDRSGELTMLNELMGHYRMSGNKDLALAAVQDGIALLRSLELAGTVSGGTILINAATALQAFGNISGALELYNEALESYRKNLPPGDWRFAGLFNNMAAAQAADGNFLQAEFAYQEALELLDKSGNLPDKAVTYVNLAQLYRQQDPGDERIDLMLDAALEIFNEPSLERNGYFAHSCNKCASAFGLAGRPADEELLKKYAGDFYAGT